MVSLPLLPATELSVNQQLRTAAGGSERGSLTGQIPMMPWEQGGGRRRGGGQVEQDGEIGGGGEGGGRSGGGGGGGDEM